MGITGSRRAEVKNVKTRKCVAALKTKARVMAAETRVKTPRAETPRMETTVHLGATRVATLHTDTPERQLIMVKKGMGRVRVQPLGFQARAAEAPITVREHTDKARTHP